jgi:hypothetical protein
MYQHLEKVEELFSSYSHVDMNSEVLEFVPTSLYQRIVQQFDNSMMGKSILESLN